ncbi:MAG: hypothetical protein AB1298_00740, partial [Bacteroidota bacterium]
RLLISLCNNDKKYFDESMILFVVNNLKSSSEEAKSDNQKSIKLLREIVLKKSGNEFINKICSTGLNVGLIDASGEGFELPEKNGGVGLARKIGMDLALAQFDYTAGAKKILICLDADCTVENNYLTSIVDTFSKGVLSDNQHNIHAAYVQYEHPLPENEKEKLAIICYELFLRYYLLGLKYANSPFAFQTIGSTMVCDYESYIKIGGMNKKKAAEDFYFMEKLAKITRIERINSTKVYPASRASWRVPFGTGQRVNRFSAGSHYEYVLYNPESFDVLKKWLAIFNSENILNTEKYLNEAKSIHPSLNEFLIRNSFEESWEKILRSSKSTEQIEKQKLIWFDGFRTLKLIHFLRDNGLPLINMFEALDRMLEHFSISPFRQNKEPIPSLEIQIKYLQTMRKLT